MNHDELLIKITGRFNTTEAHIQELKEDVKELKELLIIEQKIRTKNTIEIAKQQQTISTLTRALWLLFGIVVSSSATIGTALIIKYLKA